MTSKIIVSFLVSVSFLAIGGVAEAKNNKNHSDQHGGGKIVWDNKHDTLPVLIDSHDRSIITRYLQTNYGRKCPPGLAKKNNGCLPPGQAKKYTLGRPVSAYGELPGDLLGLLSPPRGYRYVQVDKDIVLIGEATKKAIDAVTLLSAVGN